ncbi:putative ArsR family transcriptional regulator [Roseimicrobium gellanilyticum]|uniref:Putative ArsR family transcriptional regulator n=1 Tax=Roseimicrobium gellanilyticum TaxID=748857 RepID=A0A366H408_9BACT|nr:winged helix-turn-helix transcriptional regulator [Roseimicrobium gellanilyticum]RBP36605.1 putative ArsR family transcriptional regulator [Roseimicrobium gellanilyticum]
MLHNGREIAPSVSWDILLHVKRSGGMSVNELAGALKMSYMGVKQHCDDLKKRGYVDTWRRPKQTGRPEKIYRPTEKLDVVLPSWGGELCMGLLALVSQAYGETVPERLLYSFLQQKVEQWNARMKSTGHKERAVELVKLRGNDGWICQCLDDAHGLRIVDHHSPLGEVARMFPAVWDLEVRVLSRIFGHTLQRRMNGVHVEFVIIEGIPLEEAAPASTSAGASKKGAKAKKEKEKAAAAATPAPAPEPEADADADAETEAETEAPVSDIPVAAPEAEAPPEPEETSTLPATPAEEPVGIENVVAEAPAAADEAITGSVFVTDVPVFEEEEGPVEVVNKKEQAPSMVSVPETPAPEADGSGPAPLSPVLSPVEKPKRVTKSVKQAVKAAAQQDLFDF